MAKHVRARKQYRRTFLREWRQFREMTQEEAAEAIGIMDRSNLARHELGHDAPVAVLAAFFGDMGDTVEHQHGRKRQLRVARAKQFAPRAGQQILIVELVPPLRHWLFQLPPTRQRFCEIWVVS